MDRQTKAFIAITAALGIAVIFNAVWHWHSENLLRFVVYLAITTLAGGLKVVVPGVNGSMSVSFIFILLGITQFTLPETVVLGCGATLVQCLWKMERPRRAVRIVFNVCSMMAPAIWAAYFVYRQAGRFLSNSMPLALLVAVCVYFVANTVPIAAVISLSEKKPFRKIWLECHLWSFPYYLAGAAFVALIHYVTPAAGWYLALIVLPVVYWVYRSYHLYLGRLQDEKTHAEKIASLHLRTIEALALAIDAKDHTTHDHLERVRVYALEIAKEIGVAGDELEGLKAAALLHDIGKLAVPEHIINKPGKLTAEEFEKMKIHPVVGAEILQRVNFPYPVVPLVRSHHEKWDGSGYPDGLRGEQIPLGARILSAVDCLDALASERQYRRALPLEKAMEHIASLAGKDFDPRIVEILQRRCAELEKLARAKCQADKVSASVKVERGAAPDAGLERESTPPRSRPANDFLTLIAAARQEAQAVLELSNELGSSLSLNETLSLLSSRLSKLAPYDAIAFWIAREGVLTPAHVAGDDFRLLSSLEIPAGSGVSGWVVENAKPILNGNPAVEFSHLKDPSKCSTLKSALAVPLTGTSGCLGALTLYRAEPDAFNRDDLRILLAINSKAALAVENALRYQQAQSSATTDHLTGLPNARSLFLQLDGELARSRRQNSSVVVLVCDLDGFKSVNDEHGHLRGDKVLRAFGEGLRANFREYDYVARMGGDEFVVVAPGLHPSAVEQMPERLSEIAVQAALQACPGAKLSASVGHAVYPEDGTDAEQLLTAADQRMYKSKQGHYRREGSMLPVVGLAAPPAAVTANTAIELRTRH